MSFYKKWNDNKSDAVDYIKLFLEKNPNSLETFYDGSEEDVEFAISVINSVSLEDYIKVIDNESNIGVIEPGNIPQFSKFNDGVYRLPELLEFAPDGLSYEKIGYQLVKSPTKGAGIKYGENHAKLAREFDLVSISSCPANVTSTALGKYLVKFSPDDKYELLKRLASRQITIRKMINGTANGVVRYQEIVNKVSVSTALRRRNNVRTMLEFVLKGTQEAERISKVDWKVEK